MPKIPQNHTFVMYNTHKTKDSKKLQNCTLYIYNYVCKYWGTCTYFYTVTALHWISMAHQNNSNT